MTTPILSVVVPVHDVEPYLEVCINSLLSQSLKEMEIIAVNDGSNDRSGEILDELAVQDSRLHVIHSSTNRSIGVARNTALKAATGKYVGFLDSDDWALPGAWEQVVAAAEKHDAEIVQTDATLYCHKTDKSLDYFDRDLWESLPESLQEETFCVSDCPDVLRLDVPMWRRLLRRDYLESLNFEFLPGLVATDVLASYQWLLPARRILICDVALCSYRWRRPGQTTGRTDDARLDMFTIIKRVQEELVRYDASTEIWAASIWQQIKLLLWVSRRFQDVTDREQFNVLAAEVVEQFPGSAIERFDQLYRRDVEYAALHYVLDKRLDDYWSLVDSRGVRAWFAGLRRQRISDLIGDFIALASKKVAAN